MNCNSQIKKDLNKDKCPHPYLDEKDWQWLCSHVMGIPAHEIIKIIKNDNMT